MMIIDIHTHTQIYNLLDIEPNIKYAKKFKINKIVLLGDVLGGGCQPTEEQIKEINNQTLKYVNKYSELFIGFCFLSALHNEKFINEEIDRCIKAGFKGVKLEVSANASDIRLDPIMKRLQELKMPLLHHAWSTTVIGRKPTPEINQSDPEDIAALASRFPKVKIVMAHLRGCGIRGVLEIKHYPNVYIDTSGGQPETGTIEYAVKKIGAERILYGSDAYFPGGRDFSAQLGCIFGARIKEKERELILGLNTKRILGIN